MGVQYFNCQVFSMNLYKCVKHFPPKIPVHLPLKSSIENLETQWWKTGDTATIQNTAVQIISIDKVNSRTILVWNHTSCSQCYSNSLKIISEQWFPFSALRRRVVHLVPSSHSYTDGHSIHIFVSCQSKDWIWQKPYP